MYRYILYESCSQFLTCPPHIFSLSLWRGPAVCGDGIREPSEECDCGALPCSQVDPCCDDATCTLKSGALCSVLDACCQQGPGSNPSQCTFKSASDTCRPATGACDIAETCTGASPVCPTDSVATVGTLCTTTLASSVGRCYAGSCFSHTEQCKEISALFGESWPECPSAGDDDGATACAPNPLKVSA